MDETKGSLQNIKKKCDIFHTLGFDPPECENSHDNKKFSSHFLTNYTLFFLFWRLRLIEEEWQWWVKHWVSSNCISQPGFSHPFGFCVLSEKHYWQFVLWQIYLSNINVMLTWTFYNFTEEEYFWKQFKQIFNIFIEKEGREK